jgi:hypothetical protein
LLAITAATLAAAAASLAGDEDQDPAYLIYIDPETGRYTTEDPAAGAERTGPLPIDAAEPAAASRPTPYRGALTAISAAAIALLCAVAVWQVARRRSQEPRRPVGIVTRS